jgi:hypothetical protein
MTDEKTYTYTAEEVRRIVDRQVLMNNITGFFQIAFANGGKWGMTQAMLSAGDYCHQIIMTPAAPPEKKTPDAPQPETPDE